MRFSGDEQRECLQMSCGLQFALAVFLDLDLTDVAGAAVGRDDPETQVSRSEPSFDAGDSPFTLASMVVTPVSACTLASPLACGIASVARRSTCVEPPPTCYPIAGVDLLIESDGAVFCWESAITAQVAAQIIELMIIIVVIPLVLQPPAVAQLASSKTAFTFPL
jgi:hypothetical protein